MFRLWLWHSATTVTLCVSRHFVFVFVLCVSFSFPYTLHILLSRFISHFFLALFLSLSLYLLPSPSIFAYSDLPSFYSLFHLFLFSSLTCYTFSIFLSFSSLSLCLCLFVQISLQFFSLCLFVDVGDEEEAGPLRRFQNSRERCKFLAPSISVSVPEDDPYHSDEEYYEHPLFSPEWTRSGSRPPGQAAAFRQIEGEPRMVPLCHSLLPSFSFFLLFLSLSFHYFLQLSINTSLSLSLLFALSFWSASSCLLSLLCRAHSDRSVSCGGGICFCTLFIASHLDFLQVLRRAVKRHERLCF